MRCPIHNSKQLQNIEANIRLDASTIEMGRVFSGEITAVPSLVLHVSDFAKQIINARLKESSGESVPSSMAFATARNMSTAVSPARLYTANGIRSGPAAESAHS